jgi:hypothetical protein
MFARPSIVACDLLRLTISVIPRAIWSKKEYSVVGILKMSVSVLSSLQLVCKVFHVSEEITFFIFFLVKDIWLILSSS